MKQYILTRHVGTFVQSVLRRLVCHNHHFLIGIHKEHFCKGSCQSAIQHGCPNQPRQRLLNGDLTSETNIIISPFRAPVTCQETLPRYAFFSVPESRRRLVGLVSVSKRQNNSQLRCYTKSHRTQPVMPGHRIHSGSLNPDFTCFHGYSFNHT